MLRRIHNFLGPRLILWYNLSNGKAQALRNFECEEPVYVRVTYGSGQRIREYKLDLVGVQGVRWEKGGTVRAGDYTFF